MNSTLHKLAVTGPESSGKTTLSKALSESLTLPWVPEFARIYLTLKHKAYNYDDLIRMARVQRFMEDLYLGTEHRSIICDTSMLDILVWSKVKYGRVDSTIEETVNQHYSAFLLCKPEMPWENDPLRENAGARWDLYRLFLNYLQDHKLPFIELGGSEHERLIASTEFVSAFC